MKKTKRAHITTVRRVITINMVKIETLMTKMKKRDPTEEEVAQTLARAPVPVRVPGTNLISTKRDQNGKAGRPQTNKNFLLFVQVTF